MYKALLAYDGTCYFGWQKTPSGPSIQEELEKAIARITGESVLPESASRTDRGVHAEGQVIRFTLKNSANPHRLMRGLNAVLPGDIRVRELAPCQFHPALDAMGKTYRYRICLGPVQDPVNRLYSWHIYFPLNVAKMERAARSLIGTHDFTAFANEEGKDPLCTIQSIDIVEDCIWIKGNRFLYKMVRNIVGTLVHIGCGKLPEDCIPDILASRDRKKAGITAPAQGLHLHQVFYAVK